jgi:hypothetical protein
MRDAEREQAQRERALQAWQLVVLDGPRPAVSKALRKILRVKRFDLPALLASLPGPVRRGARIDLAPLETALRQAGVRCELRRSGT